MSDQNDQDSPTEVRETPQISADAGESKAPDLVARITRRCKDIKELMIEKEAYQMTYVYDDVPKPYYQRWKDEGNELFTLAVELKRRRERAARKALMRAQKAG